MSWELKGNNGTNPNDGLTPDFLGTTDPQALAIRTRNTERLRVDENGNVGIGTTGPVAKLEVGGAIYSNTVESNSFSLNSHGANFGFISNQTAGVWSLGYGTTIETLATPVLNWTSDGNVGIGTTTPNPSYALHIHQTGSQGVLAESDTGTALAAVTNSPNFYTLTAENLQGNAIRALGAETGQFSTGIDSSGFTAVKGESQNGTAILGIAHSQQYPNVSGTGVYGQCLGKPGAGVIGYSAFGTGVIAIGGAQAAGGDGLFATTDFGWCGKFMSSDPQSIGGVFVSVPAGQPGLQVASGTKSAIVPTSQGSRSLYSEEATEVWFTEYGFGQLEGGRAVVTIDLLFAEVVNLSEPYHVFIQLNDINAEGAAITNKTESGFDVVELRNGRSNAEFSYRLVAKRRGHEQDRLQHAPWADEDPNLYPEKRDAWEAQQRLLRPDVPNIGIPLTPKESVV